MRRMVGRNMMPMSTGKVVRVVMVPRRALQAHHRVDNRRRRGRLVVVEVVVPSGAWVGKAERVTRDIEWVAHVRWGNAVMVRSTGMRKGICQGARGPVAAVVVVVPMLVVAWSWLGFRRRNGPTPINQRIKVLLLRVLSCSTSRADILSIPPPHHLSSPLLTGVEPLSLVLTAPRWDVLHSQDGID